MIPKHAAELLEWIGRYGYKPKGKEVKFLKDVKLYVDRDVQITKPMTDFFTRIYEKFPIEKPSEIQGLVRGSAYVYAILSDERISN